MKWVTFLHYIHYYLARCCYEKDGDTAVKESSSPALHLLSIKPALLWFHENYFICTYSDSPARTRGGFFFWPYKGDDAHIMHTNAQRRSHKKWTSYSPPAMARKNTSSSSSGDGGGLPSIIIRASECALSPKGVHRDEEATPSTPAVLVPLHLTTQTSPHSLPGMMTSSVSVVHNSGPMRTKYKYLCGAR